MSCNRRVNAVIVGYRRGSNTQYPSRVLLRVIDENVIPHSLIGKKVIYKDRYGNVYRGKILSVHGKGVNRILIASFKPNIPGQAIGDSAIILP